MELLRDSSNPAIEEGRCKCPEGEIKLCNFLPGTHDDVLLQYLSFDAQDLGSYMLLVADSTPVLTLNEKFKTSPKEEVAPIVVTLLDEHRRAEYLRCVYLTETGLEIVSSQ